MQFGNVCLVVHPITYEVSGPIKRYEKWSALVNAAIYAMFSGPANRYEKRSALVHAVI
jgi:hypothetical protein